MYDDWDYIINFSKTVVVAITRVSRAKFFWKKPLKNTSDVAVRMTVFKGNIQKMIARTHPCIYLCTHRYIHPCIHLCIYHCVYPCTYPCFYQPCLYVISYALFFGLGKVHMVGTCLVIAGYQLIIYRVFIVYLLVI